MRPAATPVAPRGRSPLATPLCAVVAAVALAACGQTTEDAVTGPGNLALSETPTGTHALRGTVYDAQTGPARGDSVGGIPRPVAGLAGATVAISLVTRNTVGPDTARAGTTLTPFTRLATAADGSFSVENIASGYYVLDVSPPAGSPLRPVRTYSVSFAPGDAFRLQVTLTR